MRARALALLTLTLAACSSAGTTEDTAYDLVKAKATKDLGCGEVTVKKMAQAGDTYEYQASGCNDLFSYGVDCDGGCRVVAGVRGPGLAGVWNRTGSVVDFVFSEVVNGAAKVHEDMRKADERREAMRAESERFMREVEQQMAETRGPVLGAR